MFTRRTSSLKLSVSEIVSSKLSHPKKWLAVKKNILNSENILVSFSDHHSYYIATLIYINKNYSQVYLRKNYTHLTDIGSPKTKKLLSVYIKKEKYTKASSFTHSGEISNSASK